MEVTGLMVHGVFIDVVLRFTGFGSPTPKSEVKLPIDLDFW